MRAHISAKSGSATTSSRYCSRLFVIMLTAMRRVLSTPAHAGHQCILVKLLTDVRGCSEALQHPGCACKHRSEQQLLQPGTAAALSGFKVPPTYKVQPQVVTSSKAAPHSERSHSHSFADRPARQPRLPAGGWLLQAQADDTAVDSVPAPAWSRLRVLTSRARSAIRGSSSSPSICTTRPPHSARPSLASTDLQGSGRVGAGMPPCDVSPVSVHSASRPQSRAVGTTPCCQ